MGTLSIRVLTVDELVAQPDRLASFRDPANLLTGCDAEWIRLLGENPDRRPGDPAMTLAFDDDRVVVRLDAYAAEARCGTTRFRTYWLSCFARDNSYPNRAAAGMVLLQTVGRCESVVVCGGPAARTRQLYKAVGMTELPRLVRFLYFCRLAPLAQKVLRWRWLAAPVAIALEPLRRLYYAAKRRGRRPGLGYRKVEALPEAIDPLLARDPRNQFVKHASKLNWAIRGGSECFEIARGSELIGYVVLHRQALKGGGPHRLPPMTVGTILDYYLAEDTLDARLDLLLFAIEHFRHQEVDVVECQVQEAAAAEACRRLGMKSRGGNYVFLKPPKGVTGLDGPWFYTHGSGDVILAL